ncbi:sensor histidine kinase [Zhihengliuella flava]|uniref:histidine kinase n=1 Tax=Zhihengliuella flava TaxID=1285193 RepID=A0A931GF97_9MICC|nr:ATP-binding protein [Zhihengliuella flava]MBG6085173.1 two-component system OmpR family sensor kinase [Zhihengliuella flava]
MSLRARMLMALVAMLALICLVIGLITQTVMRAQLYEQLDTELDNTVQRSLDFQQDHPAQNPLAAPGQASGTLSFLIVGERLGLGGVLDSTTGKQHTASLLSQADQAALLTTGLSRQPQSLNLTIGTYRVAAARIDDSVIISGLPEAGTRATLDRLTFTIIFVSLTGLVATALIGSLIIRRSLRPLERVSALARRVAGQQLDTGRVDVVERVAEYDAVPGTEAGNVGHALNALLDNVDSALAARQASEEKLRRFVGDASHELRTPLASVRGYSELINATEHLSADGQQAMRRVLDQSRRMGKLVDDLLLLARLDNAQSSLTPDRRDGVVDLSRLVVEEAADFRVTAPNHLWDLDVPAEAIETRGDAAQLRQVVANLLSNARKHTPEGTHIHVRLGLEPQAVVFSVTDTGDGIAEEFQPHVFERFTRADAARSGSDGTTGLGLPIVKAIVEAHGGSIELESQPRTDDSAGRTTFTVRLPRSADRG